MPKEYYVDEPQEKYVDVPRDNREKKKKAHIMEVQLNGGHIADRVNFARYHCEEILGGAVFAKNESDKEIYRMGAGHTVKDGKLAKNKAAAEYDLLTRAGLWRRLILSSSLGWKLRKMGGLPMRWPRSWNLLART